jgi:hypothetical protein
LDICFCLSLCYNLYSIDIINTILNIVTMQSKVSTNPKIEKHPGCVAEAVSIMGNKWTALLIMELAKGPTRFCALETSLEGISPRTLSQRLYELEQKSVINKKKIRRSSAPCGIHPDRQRKVPDTYTQKYGQVGR